jgi:preprotein translocase subunit SecB
VTADVPLTSLSTAGSGYALQMIFLPAQHYELLEDSSEYEDAPVAPIRYGTNWRRIDEENIEIAIRVEIKPTRRRTEYVGVTVVGRFQLLGEALSLPVESFARGNAPAILFPYAREAISGLTGQGPFSAVLLPPMNLTTLQVADETLEPSKEATIPEK